MVGQSQKKLETLFSTDQLHHAYLLEGEAVSIVPELRRLLEKELGIVATGNPDFRHIKTESLTVDDARQLREAQQVRTFSGGKKIFILEVSTITNEAQNALLKILEEPTTGTHFFLTMPSRWLLLPAVRSRLQIISMVPPGQKSGSGTALAFMKAAPAERLALLVPILEEKDKAAALVLVDDLVAYTRERGGSQKHVVLKELLHVRQYVNDRSASLKLLLEHVALTLPSL